MKKRRAKQQVLRGIHPGTYKVLTASHRSERSASRQHMLRDHGKQRSQTHNKFPGERVELSAENSSSRGFLVKGGWERGEQGSPASLAFTYILASWSLGAGKTRWASRSLKKKKTSPNS